MTDTIKVGNRHYHLGCTLGVGGFSEVKKGVDSQTSKRVALKIMYTDESDSPSELKSQLVQVQKEIKAMKQLNHANIIRLLGYDLKCKVGQRNAIVMVQQLAPKGELFDYLMYTKNFPQHQAISLFHQLVAGLEAMHDAGIAHRDLKPENLLFDNSYNLKLADFGFSFAFQKGEGPKTAMRTELGTKGYMAPEILSNKKYTEKADIFAAGVILFIMLAGFPPFQNAVPKDWWFDKLQKKKYKLFWMAHERTASFSAEAKQILQSMLAPKEMERLDIKQVQQTAFYKADCLTKDELSRELRKRKRVVDQQKADAQEGAGESRDIFGEILVRENEMLPNTSPILLRDIVQVQFTDDLQQKGLEQTMIDHFDDQEFLELKKVFDELDDAQKKAAVEKFIASSSAETPEAFMQMVKEEFVIPDSQLAKKILDNLHTTNMGVVDDLTVLEKFDQMERGLILPEFQPYKLKAHAYKTQIGLGILGYFCRNFAKKYGKMTIHQNPPMVILKMKTKRKSVLPEEQDDGEVVWREVEMPVKVQITIKMFYDPELKTNVLTFENSSKSQFGMPEYRSIVNELTTNNEWFLARLITGSYDIEECNTADCDIDENDVHDDEEEEVQGQA